LKLESISDIAAFCLKNVESFNAVNVATAFHRLAKYFRKTGSRLAQYYRGDDEHKAVSSLKALALIIASTFKPQEVANLMWALAALNYRPDKPLVQAMLGFSQYSLHPLHVEFHPDCPQRAVDFSSRQNHHNVKKHVSLVQHPMVPDPLRRI
jgi:hypothetical protein